MLLDDEFLLTLDVAQSLPAAAVICSPCTVLALQKSITRQRKLSSRSAMSSEFRNFLELSYEELEDLNL